MQVTKEHIHETLLQTARQAFFEKGFKGVSMREISHLSGVGLSNIYNYYPNKEEILADVLQPLLDSMDRMLTEHNSPQYVTLEVFTSEAILRSWLDKLLEIICRYRQELKLLFFASQGSRFETFVDDWAERSVQIGKEYMHLMQARYPDLNTDISTFFIHFSSYLSTAIMRELVQHDNLTKADLERFVGEYLLFTTGGWKQLMRYHTTPPSPTRHTPHLT